MNIETQRMLIRDYIMDDVRDLHDILGDDEVMKNCEPAYSLEKTSNFLSEFCIGKRGAVAAVHKDSGKMIGYILFNEFDESVYEIGWFFNKNFWRQGYGYESCKAVIDFAFNELDAHKIFAETIDCVKAVGLMKKLGMQLEGIQRSHTKDNDGNWADLYLYGLFKDDWNSTQKKEKISSPAKMEEKQNAQN
ncbi:MAG: GNAT family N-acetyltransferase [Bacillus sp. (in: Bacteria)]|nr:GNAT family N-acetyltransferase [Butyrivibrio sp.]MCM1388481.1 GNAT family N-acetyltransferase [Bacillus sp. (in: firmicutes)]